jgi:hypothetical protein
MAIVRQETEAQYRNFTRRGKVNQADQITEKYWSRCCAKIWPISEKDGL